MPPPPGSCTHQARPKVSLSTGACSPLQFLSSPARAKPAGQEQEKRPGALWQMWEQGLGPPEHSSLSGGWGELVVYTRRPSCQPACQLIHPRLRGLPCLCQGGERVLTHTKLSLGVQLEAFWAADFILFCKAKKTVPRDRRR